MKAVAIKKGQSKEKAAGFQEMGTLRVIYEELLPAAITPWDSPDCTPLLSPPAKSPTLPPTLGLSSPIATRFLSPRRSPNFRKRMSHSSPIFSASPVPPTLWVQPFSQPPPFLKRKNTSPFIPTIPTTSSPPAFLPLTLFPSP